jgi:CSLREA domain-containing protein
MLQRVVIGAFGRGEVIVMAVFIVHRSATAAGGSVRRSGRAAIMAACAGLLLVAGAHAATFNVNSTADVPDATPGNGTCETATGNNICTLRAAVAEANALAGLDTINLQADSTYLLTRVGVDEFLKGDLDLVDSANIVGAGPGSTIIDANGDITGDRALNVHECIGDLQGCPQGIVSVSVSGVTFQHGHTALAPGGAIRSYGDLTLTNCVVTENTSGAGGGIVSQRALTIMNSAVTNNVAQLISGGGGGIFVNGGSVTVVNSTIAGNSTACCGGGLFVLSSAAGAIIGSTISGNSAARGGGGLYSRVADQFSVVNSTISGNHSDEDGGGIYNYLTTALFNATVANNMANADASGSASGGGVYNLDGGVLTFVNSIIAYNLLGLDINSPTFALGDDCSGTIISQGFSILPNVNTSWCTVLGSFSAASPLLGPLQGNGGPTTTHALQVGSAAIDTGDPDGCIDHLGATLATDQRGLPRPIGAACDIGAYEVQPNLIFEDNFEI